MERRITADGFTRSEAEQRLKRLCRQAFERDRRKDAALQAAGHRVVRITWRRLTTEPLSLSAQFGALLRRA